MLSYEDFYGCVVLVCDDEVDAEGDGDVHVLVDAVDKHDFASADVVDAAAGLGRAAFKSYQAGIGLYREGLIDLYACDACMTDEDNIRHGRALVEADRLH